MKTFSSSQLSKKPAEVLAAAREDGAIIQIKRTNGEVLEEFVMVQADSQAICQLHQNDELNPVGMR